MWQHCQSSGGGGGGVTAGDLTPTTYFRAAHIGGVVQRVERGCYGKGVE